jgi:phosphatidate cytidylyltransferase
VLKTRIITAMLMLSVLACLLWLASPNQLMAVLTLICLGGVWEWTRLAQFSRLWSRLLYTLAVILVAAVAYLLSRRPGGLLLLLAIAAIGWVCAALWLFLYSDRLAITAVRCLGPCVLLPAWLGLSALVWRSEQVPAVSLIVACLGLVAAADIGAYFAGRLFGRHALAPAISPGKTWEGVMGGTTVGLLVAGLGAQWLHISLAVCLPIGLTVVWVSVVGDLLESRVKRFAGVKDSGACLPGHGGLLDRLDSITAAVPFFVLGMMLCGFVR